MGTFKPGPMGVVKGLIDTIVASKWKDTFVVKGRPTKSNKAASLQQADQRIRFALVTTLLKRIGSTISVGYQNSGKNLTPMNVASKYHLANAVKGIYPDYEFDFTRLKLTNGFEESLDFAWQPVLTAEAGATVTVAWQLKSHPGKTSSITDRLTLLFYNVEEDSFITLESAAARSELKRSEELPAPYIGDNLHCWAFFVSPDGKRVSKSQYLGMVKLLA